MALRSIWNGTIGFAGVFVPVKVHSATEDRTVHFHEVHVDDGARIEHRRICPKEDKKVPYKEIVKGYEVSEGRYVVLEDDELEAAAGPGSRLIELGEFVPTAEIDPVFFVKTYYLGSQDAGKDAYRLLHDVLQKTARAGIGRCRPLRRRRRGRPDLLRPSLLARARRRRRGRAARLQAAARRHGADRPRGARHVRDAREGAPRDRPRARRRTDAHDDAFRRRGPLDEGRPERRGQEHEAEPQGARQRVALVAALGAGWKPEVYEDEYRKRLQKIVDDKRKRKTIRIQDEDEKQLVPVPDLMAALQAALADAKKKTAPAKRNAKAKA